MHNYTHWPGPNKIDSRLDNLADLVLHVQMHIKQSLALYCLDPAQARIGVIVDVVPGMPRPYLISDRFSKIRFWASEEEVLESIVPAQPSTSRATIPGP